MSVVQEKVFEKFACHTIWKITRIETFDYTQLSVVLLWVQIQAEHLNYNGTMRNYNFKNNKNGHHTYFFSKSLKITNYMIPHNLWAKLIY